MGAPGLLPCLVSSSPLSSSFQNLPPSLLPAAAENQVSPERWGHQTESINTAAEELTPPSRLLGSPLRTPVPGIPAAKQAMDSGSVSPKSAPPPNFSLLLLATYEDKSLQSSGIFPHLYTALSPAPVVPCPGAFAQPPPLTPGLCDTFCLELPPPPSPGGFFGHLFSNVTSSELPQRLHSSPEGVILTRLSLMSCVFLPILSLSFPTCRLGLVCRLLPLLWEPLTKLPGHV